MSNMSVSRISLPQPRGLRFSKDLARSLMLRVLENQ